MRTLRLLAALLSSLAAFAPASAQSELDDLEMAHVAVTAGRIDISYAHLALALSEDDVIRSFAETMIRDHGAVNARVFALADELGVQARDNDVSRRLLEDAERIKDEMSGLRGADFDRYYLRNELRYHRAVNGLVAEAFIPGIEHPEVKEAFRSALTIFRGHERHAAELVEAMETARR